MCLPNPAPPRPPRSVPVNLTIVSGTITLGSRLIGTRVSDLSGITLPATVDIIVQTQVG